MKEVRNYQHKPVLLKESVAPFQFTAGTVWVDATFGGGGHTRALLDLNPDAKVWAIDQDPAAAQRAQERFPNELANGRLRLLQGRYGNLSQLLADQGVHQVDGILVDAGVSSFQIDDPERGFSFQSDGPLDMRMDTKGGLSAADILASETESELERIFRDYGEERYARKVARAIVQDRVTRPFLRTSDLSGLLQRILPRDPHGPHPATRVFQGLRIAVNEELKDLERLLRMVPNLLKPKGVLSAISFHSLEDRLIKDFTRNWTAHCVCPPVIPTCARCGHPIGLITQRKPVVPSPEEIELNPRSRTAKLRVFVRNSEELREAAVLDL
jgi:16S rRNA (cytosine1402-N4)-methyltransferase